jgi:hypothetical protein|tara:strand:- start:590 stop:811 length:222 start_codon:yes stop_codon:yes gene_type:complete
MAEFKLMKTDIKKIQEHAKMIQEIPQSSILNTGKALAPNLYTLKQKSVDNFKKIKPNKTLYQYNYGRFDNGIT